VEADKKASKDKTINIMRSFMTRVSGHKSRNNYFRQLLERFDRYCQLLNLHQAVIDGKWFQKVRRQIKSYVSKLYPKTIGGADSAIKINLMRFSVCKRGINL
jgi:hypothetical protein